VYHYSELNKFNLCNTYRDFVKDYVLYRQSERAKKRRHQRDWEYFHIRSLSSKSKALLNDSKYGHLFQKAKKEMDKVEVRHSEVGNDYYIEKFIASNVTDKDRFFLDEYTSGVTYGGRLQPKLFSTIEYNRCSIVDKHFGWFDNFIYFIEKNIKG
jgi:hypothetical protein